MGEKKGTNERAESNRGEREREKGEFERTEEGVDNDFAAADEAAGGRD